MQEVQLSVARRAYELFEARHREHGHDWEDWFRAESEVLRPVSVAISEAPDHISVRANVLGLSPNELRVSVEPGRVIIMGGKGIGAVLEAKNVPAEPPPDQLLRIVSLSSEVDPEGAVVELESGVLRLELPKMKIKKAAKAATA